MRISDWSSDVCSSDLWRGARPGMIDADVADLVVVRQGGGRGGERRAGSHGDDGEAAQEGMQAEVSDQIGRASCGESVWQYGENTVVAVSIKNKKQNTHIKPKE